jgi:hypothetical protein
MSVTHTPAVETVFIGPTDCRGSRVRAKILGSGKRVIVNWRHELGIEENHQRAAKIAVEHLLEPPITDCNWLVSGIDGGGFMWMIRKGD